MYFGSLDSDLSRQSKRFWSFFKLKNKTRTFPEVMSSGNDNHQGSQASTPQYMAELLCMGFYCSLRDVHFASNPYVLTPHIK